MSMIPVNPFKKLIAGRDRLSASQYNRLIATVSKNARSLLQHGMADSSGINTRRPNISIIRKAYVKTTPAAVTTVDCYLDVDSTGKEITVHCSITINGSSLNAAVPRLNNGDIIFVTNISGIWWCVTVFNRSIDC